MGDAEKYVKDALDRGERLMGFGHRVYRAEDPRARVLRRTAHEVGAPRVEVAEALEEAALAELKARKPDRVLATNVEFWSAVVLDFADVPPELFTPMFTCARVAGWSAHILEQKREGRLIRPTANYVGPRARGRSPRSRHRPPRMVEAATTEQAAEPVEGVSSFAKSLFLGEIHEDLVFPFPKPDEEEQRRIRGLIDSLRELADEMLRPARGRGGALDRRRHDRRARRARPARPLRARGVRRPGPVADRLLPRVARSSRQIDAHARRWSWACTSRSA